MPPEYGRQSRYIGRVYDQALSAELFFLPLAQSIAHLSPISMIDFSSEFVSELLTIELNENTPSKRGVINVVQDMQGFDEASQMHEGPRECCGSFSNLQNSHNACGFQVSELERTRETDQIFPVLGDELGVDGALSNCIEGAIVGRFIGTPEPRPANISQARAEGGVARFVL